ncbi:MAG TPA: tetratricopeptide repeat protein [Bryobacteraceae bacterium]
MLRRTVALVLIILAGVSCSRDPEVVKKKYLQNGNRYFEKQKYKEAYIMYRNALKKDGRYSEAYYRVGLTELRMLQPMDALRDFRRAIDTDPRFTNPDARVQAGNILLMGYMVREDHPAQLADELRVLTDALLKHNAKSVQGLRLDGYLKMTVDHNPKAAIAQFRLASQISPNEPDVVLPLVESLLADQQDAEAEKLGHELIQKHKDFTSIYDVLYVHYVRSKRLPEAEQILKLKASNNPKDPDPLLQMAQLYYGTQRLDAMRAVLDKLSSDRANFPDGARRAGRFYAVIRDFDTSIRVYQAGMRQDPEHKGDYQKEIAQVLLSQNKKDEAARLLDEVLKANPKDDAAHAMRAALLIETGDPKQIQQAIAELQTSVGQQPSNPVLRFNLGRALLIKGQLEQARVQFQEALKHRPEYGPARLALAQIYLSRREFGNAIQEADTALKYDAGSLNAHLIRANALAAMGNPSQARDELNQTIQKFPNSPEAALLLASLDMRERRYADAEQAFQRLYKVNPADLRALLGLSETYAVQKQYDKAAAVLRAELAKSPDRLELRAALGNVLYRSGNFDLATEQYQAILQARPDAVDIYVRLGETYAAKGDLPAAIRAFDKAKQLRPNDPAAYLQLALLYERSGRPMQARPIYEQILKLQPDHGIALNNLAYLLAENSGDLDEALALAQRARQRMPTNNDVADTLGWIYIKKNLSDNAVSIFRDLVTKDPARSTFRYHLAMALYQRGDKPAARKELLGALELKPSSAESAKIKDLIARTQ